ncbi:Oidioi.mRNA.OKI2018_I69.PAR.g11266.t1.cds [Oikopleura dioica]|uniref:Oidioi.mRNA.OKI2018_I69.PAR.g11266.t1.cds n=1 Tax=Oikopleura dioica TaxID=34765 RepID=A0ABN7RY25_OIKDI|nr:Oidioi.mRNA.OKI2018_I69.PAR.g11266.t1.cds [Oikopleura dioica]
MANSRYQRLLVKDFHSLLKEPSEFFTLRPINDNFYHFTATIHGLEGSLYEGGHFLLDIKVNKDYPFDCVKMTFLTPILHPGIDSAGNICPSTINDGEPCMRLEKKLHLLVSTLYDPKGLLWRERNAKIVAMFVSDRERFNQKAREYTRLHATQSKHAELYTKQYAENSMNSS